MGRRFTIDSHYHGKGPIVYAWHPSSRFVATAGTVKIVYVFNWRGKLIDKIALKGPCSGLEWDAGGETLAVLHSVNEILLWDFETKQEHRLDLSLKEPTLMKWARTGKLLAVGTARGEVVMYDNATKTNWTVAAKHKKRVTCGDWNADQKFAFASDDRQITVATPDGKTVGQVKVKSRPTILKFGGHEKKENIVSVSMERKTILLYNLEDPDNALELAFQQHYGHIVAFHWFRQGYIVVGFSLGFLVVISTHLSQIAQEQFMRQYHKRELRDIVHCPHRQQMVTAGDNCIKVVDMKDWKPRQTEEIDKSTGQVDRVMWTADGSLVSVSTRSGYLHVFEMDPSDARSETTAMDFLLQPLDLTSFVACFCLTSLLLLLIIAFTNHASLLDMWVLLVEYPTF